MIVLKYIANEVRRFVTFVANRVAVIRQESDPGQWRHVRSELNPADYASRGINASETGKLERWRRGPKFFWREVEGEELRGNLTHPRPATKAAYGRDLYSLSEGSFILWWENAS